VNILSYLLFAILGVALILTAVLCFWTHRHPNQDGNVTPRRDPHDPVIRDPRSLRERWLTGHQDDGDQDGRVSLRVLLIAGAVLVVVLVVIALWNRHSDPSCGDWLALYNCR
jgi:hypothetical protein